MSQRAELKSCPFCGAAASLIQWKEHATFSFVQCDECGGRTMRHLDEDAIAAWNRRAPSVGREEIARIIDGEAFCDAFAANCHFETRRQAALSKADAILSALSRGDGRG